MKNRKPGHKMIDLCDKILKDIKPSEEQIINFPGYWIPLQWLYCEMVKNKGIEPIGELGETEKHRYWKMTEGEQWKRICQVQALYVNDCLKVEL